MKAAQLNRSLMGRRKFIVLGGAALGGIVLAATSANSDTSIALAGEAPSSSVTFTPGTYTAEWQGKKGPVTVEVTFGEDAIQNVEVIAHHETPRISAVPFSVIPQQIVERQSVAIDTVAGATFSSNALLNAVRDCVEQADADPKALEIEPQKSEPQTVEIDADIVVVGAGAAGMTAALEGAIKGAEVVVFEKAAYVGGNALVSGGVLTYIDAPQELRVTMNDGYRSYFEQTLQKAATLGISQDYIDEVQAQFDAYYANGNETLFDSPEWQAIYNLVAMGSESASEDDYQGMLAYAQSNLPLMEWLEQFEVGYEPLISVAGYPWPDNVRPLQGECGEGWFGAFDRYIEKNSPSIDFLMETPATSLIVEDGVVTGVEGTCADGTVYRAKAAKGVVLATGGFSGNRALLEEHDDEWGFASMDWIPTSNGYGHDGDGLVMALDAGAAFEDANPNFMVLPLANAVDQSVEALVGDSGNSLLVNQQGVRFVNETLSRNEISKAMMAQDGQMCYLISDAVNSRVENGLNINGVEIDLLLANEKVFRADTLEELAQIAGIEPQELAKTVESFNTLCDAGEDPDFGRTLFNEQTPVTQPPFYAYPCHWATHITNCGVSIDWDTYQALDDQGNPVPGLYAVGELTPTGGGIDVMSYGIACVDGILG